MLTLDTRDVQLAIDRARAEQAAAEAQLRLVQAGARVEDIRQAESQIDTARADVAAAAIGARRRRTGPRALRHPAQEQLGLAQAARRCGDDDGMWRGTASRQPQSRVRTAEEGARQASRRRASRRDRCRTRPRERRRRRRSRHSRRASTDATLLSPVAGLVTEKLVEVGEMIAAARAGRGRRGSRSRVGRRVRAGADRAADQDRPAGHGLHRCRRRWHRRHDLLHLAEGRVHAAQRADRGRAIEARLPRPHQPWTTRTAS